jgi:hypothetical protein
LKHVSLYKMLLSSKSTTAVEADPLNKKSLVRAGPQGFTKLETLMVAY